MQFAATQAYEDVSGTPNDQGIVVGDNGTEFTVSKNNSISINQKDCGDGTLGYYAEVSNTVLVAMIEQSNPEILAQINNSGNALAAQAAPEPTPEPSYLTYSYDSCEDGSIKKN